MRNPLRRWGIVAAGVTLAACPLTSTQILSPASAAESGPSAVTNSEGNLVSVSARPGKSLQHARGSVRAAARAYIRRYASRFGTSPARMRVDSTTAVPGGTVVRLQQYVDGHRVLGAQIVEQLGGKNQLRALNGRVSPTKERSGHPTASKAGLRDRATRSLSGEHRSAKQARRARKQVDTSTALAWYDPAIFDNHASTGKLRLVYQVTVEPTSLRAEGGKVLYDAKSGKQVRRISATREATNRAVCDANGSYVSSSASCGSPDRGEGDPATGIADVDDAYDNFGLTSSYYQDSFGYDLTSQIGSTGGGIGQALRAIVRACVSGYGCPMQNAFWNGYGMTFGDGFAGADDVITHELTHGVTEHTSGLQYSYEAGAINESMSDVLGELEDQANGSGDDGSAVRWELGEDLPASIGVIRDMADPPAYNQPDKMSSPLYYNGSGDNGGVHYNSGVGNKAAYLVAAGGNFNGQSISGIGNAKAAQVWWRAENTLTSSADYAELGDVLSSGCAALASAGTGGITASDCNQVDKAVAATEM